MTTAAPLTATSTTGQPRHLHLVTSAQARTRPDDQPHGTASRFRRCTDGSDGRACLPCRSAYCEDEVRRRREKRHGRDRWTDARPVQEHLRLLLTRGSYAAIARQSGLSQDTIRYVATGPARYIAVSPDGTARLHEKRVHRNTALAILDIKPEHLDGCRADEVPARPTQRLIEGMAAQGWSLEWQSRTAGLGRLACSKVLRSERTLRTNAEAIERLAEQVGDAKGQSFHARGLARRRGWLPLAWGDDEEIAELRRLTHKALVDPSEPRTPRRRRASA